MKITGSQWKLSVVLDFVCGSHRNMAWAGQALHVCALIDFRNSVHVQAIKTNVGRMYSFFLPFFGIIYGSRLLLRLGTRICAVYSLLSKQLVTSAPRASAIFQAANFQLPPTPRWINANMENYFAINLRGLLEWLSHWHGRWSIGSRRNLRRRRSRYFCHELQLAAEAARNLWCSCCNIGFCRL